MAQDCCIPCKLQYVWCLLTARWHWQNLQICKVRQTQALGHLFDCISPGHCDVEGECGGGCGCHRWYMVALLVGVPEDLGVRLLQGCLLA